MSDSTDLLFFETFSHESSEELNLDLVQFPKPVYVSEVRIIPLGARVQGDFPGGGVRLGATNPSQFRIDFFVNDLSKPGASTFETLGSLEYCQNGTIHMECPIDQVSQMPTDGLVLKGWYTTVTLAVYGRLTKSLNDPPAESSQQNIQRSGAPRDIATNAIPTVSQQNAQDWNPEIVTAYNTVSASTQEVYIQQPYNSEDYESNLYRNEFYDQDAPKDPRVYTHAGDGDNPHWDKVRTDLSRERECSRENDRIRHSPNRDIDRQRRSADRDRDRRDLRSRQKSRSIDRDRERSRESSRPRARSRDVDRRERLHSRSISRDRDYAGSKSDYRPLSRERDNYRSSSRSPGYHEQDGGFSHDKNWDRGPYKRDYNRSTFDCARDGSYDKHVLPYEKRAPSFEKHSAYDHKNSYERRAPSYEKQMPYERHINFEKRPSYDRIRDTAYDGRSPGTEDPRKKPRTPPIDTNRRPHTPVDVDTPHDRVNLSPVDSIASDEAIIDYNRTCNPTHKEVSRVKGYKHSPSPTTDKVQKSNYVESQHSSLLTVKVVENQISPSQKIVASIESPTQQQDDLSMDAEQFEPILSDEDICDDSEAFGDVDFDINDYCNADDVIKCFNPFKFVWSKYDLMYNTKLFLSPDSKHSNVLNLSFAELSALNENIVKLYELTKLSFQRNETVASFQDLNSSTKEEWVNQCEQLPTIISQLSSESDILARIFDETKGNVKDEFGEILKFIIEFCKTGLNFDYAVSQSQPTYRIRHMKCGIRLLESLMLQKYNGLVISSLLNHGIDVCVLLLKMYSKDYMALSIRLMILKSLDACLSSQEAIEHFLTNHIYGESEVPLELVCKPKGNSNFKMDTILRNGYQTLIVLLGRNPLSRVKFALNALLKKLNTYELLKKLRETVVLISKQGEGYVDNYHDISDGDVDFIVNSLDELWTVYRNGAFDISQPKRFLPLSAQFEINKDSNTRDVLFKFFQAHKFLETCVFLLSCPLTYNNFMITNPIYEVVNDILNSQQGLCYLSSNMDATEVLFKCLSQPIAHQMNDESLMFLQDISNYSEVQLLGLEMAYRLQTKYYVDAICDLLTAPDMEFELVEKLQALYSLTFNSIGKLAVVSVLSMSDNIQCLLDVFDKDTCPKKGDKYDSLKYKTPAKSYAVDLTVSTLKFSSNVSFLTKFGKKILIIAKKYDHFDQSISVYLQEILPFLKPLEKPNILSCDSVADVVDIVKGCLDRVSCLPGEMITCLRIMKYFSIPEYEGELSTLSEQATANYIELKYKYNILQLYGLDGVSYLTTILEKLTAQYDQPFLHTHTFVSTYGLNLAHVILLCLQLLNKMLTYVIQCRNTQFKDTTAIPVLLKTYSLLRAYPSNALGYRTAQTACKEAIETLLAYTQPMADDANETETISKTLWTLMCSEIISYILSAPCTFVPGLLIFSELLPLPLPIPTKISLHQNEISKINNNRKLWSAHLHTLSNNLTEMIQTMCISAYQPVTQMLRRVCVQIADLASNMALVVVRAVIDLILKEICNENNLLNEPFAPCSHKVARLFSFLACLLAHSSVKCTVLHLIRQTIATPKVDERYWLFVSILCTVLRTPSDLSSHIQSQEYVASIISSLCDSEISLLMQTDSTVTIKVDHKSEDNKDFAVTSDIYLANALPPKDALLKLINATFEYLSNDGSSLLIISSILRTYFMLSEHDFGFYYFKNTLDKNKSVFVQLFNKVVTDISKDSAECLSILLELLRLLQSPSEDIDNSEILQFSPRSCYISPHEVSELIGFTNNDDHPIFTLEKFLKDQNADEDLIANAVHLSTSVKRAVNGDGVATPLFEEQALPPAETLSIQFTNRAVCTQGDSHDERLSLDYWLNIPNLTTQPLGDDEITEADIVACDIMEIANTELLPSGGAQSLLVALNDLLHAGTEGASGVLHGSRDSAANDCLSQDPKHRIQSMLHREKKTFGHHGFSGSPTGTTATSAPGMNAGSNAAVAADAFRSRPPNTSRPPSLHVDDFVALEGRGAQPTGPTGYNKLTAAAVAARGRALRSRGIPIADRGRFASATPQLTPHFRTMRGRGAWGANEMTNSHHFIHFPQAAQYGGGNWNHMARGRGHRGLRHMRNSFIR